MEVVKSSELVTADSKQQQQFHVLVVDDSELDRKLVETLLKRSTFKVTCVDSGDEALKTLGLLDIDLNQSSSDPTISPKSSSDQEGPINLIITDYCMPGMSGYDLLKRIKGSYWKDVPVVVMSADNVPSRISMCLEEGAEAFLLKPPKLSDLRKLIQPYLIKSLTILVKSVKPLLDDLSGQKTSLAFS